MEGLSSPGRFQDVSFTLRAGEVLGLAGLVGAGRSEVAQALFGLDRGVTGRVWIRTGSLELLARPPTRCAPASGSSPRTASVRDSCSR